MFIQKLISITIIFIKLKFLKRPYEFYVEILIIKKRAPFSIFTKDYTNKNIYLVIYLPTLIHYIPIYLHIYIFI